MRGLHSEFTAEFLYGDWAKGLETRPVGRPPLGAKAMTEAERSQGRREKIRDNEQSLGPISDLPESVRILALSDIHNNVGSVQRLRAQESNKFDVVIVAGDLGSEVAAAAIFKLLGTFGCPIFYVRGNWDRGWSTEKYGKNIHLIHRNVVKLGVLAFTGFSSTDPQPDRLFVERCHREIGSSLAKDGIDLRNTIFLSHVRATFLRPAFPGLLLHIFGHRHTFDCFGRGGTTYVNVSALDRPRPASGNYAVIEINQMRKVTTERRLLVRPT